MMKAQVRDLGRFVVQTGGRVPQPHHKGLARHLWASPRGARLVHTAVVLLDAQSVDLSFIRPVSRGELRTANPVRVRKL
jgi:hypothetical protein